MGFYSYWESFIFREKRKVYNIYCAKNSYINLYRRSLIKATPAGHTFNLLFSFPSPICALEFSGCGQYMATCCEDKTLTLWSRQLVCPDWIERTKWYYIKYQSFIIGVISYKLIHMYACEIFKDKIIYRYNSIILYKLSNYHCIK